MKKDKEEKKTNLTKAKDEKKDKKKDKVKKEETEHKELIKVKNNNFLGILGAILGGLVASIPWILVYIYGNVMMSVLSIIIAVGVFYGYKLFGGKVTKSLPITIIIISVLIVIFTTLVSIPVFFIHSEGVDVSFNAIKILYEDMDFLEGISSDAIIATIFTIFGSSVISANIKKKIANGETENIDLSNTEEVKKIKLDSISKIKPIFEKFNAVEKENGILKDELYAELNENAELKMAFNNLKSFGIIKKSKGRFYYSIEAEDKQIKAKKKINSKALTLIMGIIFICTMIGVVAYNEVNNNKPQEVTDDVMSFKIDADWEQGSSYYDDGEWIYYRYINSTPSEEITEGDYSKYPATVDVMYFANDVEAIPDLDTVQQTVKESIMSQDVTPETYEEKIETTSNGYNVLKVKLIYKADYQSIEYVNYLLKGDMIAVIDTYSYNLDDESELKKTIEKITESFKWKE